MMKSQILVDKSIIKKHLFNNEINYSNVRIEGNNFNDNVWRIKNKNLKFEIFKDRPIMINQVKKYLLKQYIKNSLSTLIRKFDGIKFFANFINFYYPDIDKFEDLNSIIINRYFNYIMTFKYKAGFKKSHPEGKKLSKTSLNKNSNFLKELFYEGIRRKWINKEKVFIDELERLQKSIIRSTPRHKKAPKTTKKKYPEEVINEIIIKGYEDDDLYLKAILLLQTQCGLRIEEVLSIEEDCISGGEDNYKITYKTKKTKKGIVEVKKPINNITVEAITDLKGFTSEIRNELNTKSIFVYMRNHGHGIARNREYPKYNKDGSNVKYRCGFVKKSNINRDYINRFVKRNNIKLDGEYIELSTHYFRHFFAQLSWMSNLSFKSIKEMLNHESYAMTAVYLKNVEGKIREKFIKMMSDPEKIVGNNIEEYKEKLSKNNYFKGTTKKQLDAIIGVMNIQILANGACMHHPLKSTQKQFKCKPNCLNCENFITHKSYIDVHKLRVNRLDTVMESAKQNNREFWYKKNKKEKDFIIKNYIEPFEKINA